MKQTKITEIKLIKKGERLELGLEQSGDVPGDDTFKGANLCHPDLIKAVEGLRIHLAILSEYLPMKTAHKDEKELKKFVVTGYSLGGKEGNEGITIKGYRKLARGGVVTLNPFVLFEEKEDSRYPLIGDIVRKKKEIEKEVNEYLAGKRGDPELFESQRDADDEENDADEGQEGRKGPKGATPISAFPKIPKADPEAMERVKNDGLPPTETKEDGMWVKNKAG